MTKVEGSNHGKHRTVSSTASLATKSAAHHHEKLPASKKKKYQLVSQWKKEETDYEKFLRIKAHQEQKDRKESDRAIKKLKKEGKVQSISGFLVSKEEIVDDWMESKKEKFRRKRHMCREHHKPVHSNFQEPPETSAGVHPVPNGPSSEDCRDIHPLVSKNCFFNARTNKPIVRKNGN